MLVENSGFIRLGFADKLKDVVADLYGFSHEQMYGDEKSINDARYNLTPRQVLQQFGQEQRSRFEDIWAAYVGRQIVEQNKSGRNRFVISDFRFPNEFHVMQNYLSSINARIIPVRITRSGLADFAGMNDISETALDSFPQWSFELENNTTKEALLEEACKRIL